MPKQIGWNFLKLSNFLGNCYNAEYERNTNAFGKKLKEARTQKGLSQKAVAKGLQQYNIHVQAPAITKWETGRSLPSIYQLFALCRLLNIEDGVRFFSGHLHSDEAALNEDGLKKVEAYRSDILASHLYDFAKTQDNVDDEIMVPHYAMPSSICSKDFLRGEECDTLVVKRATVPTKADFALTISGDSMEPNYKDGQLVWIEETSELRSGEIGFFIVGGYAYIRMYAERLPNYCETGEHTSNDGLFQPKTFLIPLHWGYKPIQVEPSQAPFIVGRVLR